MFLPLTFMCQCISTYLIIGSIYTQLLGLVQLYHFERVDCQAIILREDQEKIRRRKKRKKKKEKGVEFWCKGVKSNLGFREEGKKWGRSEAGKVYMNLPKRCPQGLLILLIVIISLPFPFPFPFLLPLSHFL